MSKQKATSAINNMPVRNDQGVAMGGKTEGDTSISELNGLNMPPSASILLGALRGMGYSPGAAVADIIDNSITAGAKNVHINFAWNGEDSWISILDDGCGMSPDELQKAMRLGCIPVKAERKPTDLGRFGLGLKTASLSQCRRLTVASIKNQEFSCLRWDLDVLENSGDKWILMHGPVAGSEEKLTTLRDQNQGTLVLWELPDRIFPTPTEEFFFDVIDEIEDHLAVTFQSYLTENHLKIFINGRRVSPRDPFMSMYDGTITLPKAYLDAGTTVQGYILPPQSSLTPEVYHYNGLPRGWTASQGFYLYRNKRLILAGSWLRLPGLDRDPFCNLARIRVDISNSMDAAWKIDIRKATARPPLAIRNELVRIAKDVRQRAKVTLLGKKTSVSATKEFSEFQVWLHPDSPDEGLRINTDNPIIAGILRDVGNTLAGRLHKLFKILAQTLPFQTPQPEPFSCGETQKDSMKASAEPPESVKEAIGYVLQAYLNNGLTMEQACRILSNTNGFSRWTSYIKTLEGKRNE